MAPAQLLGSCNCLASVNVYSDTLRGHEVFNQPVSANPFRWSPIFGEDDIGNPGQSCFYLDKVGRISVCWSLFVDGYVNLWHKTITPASYWGSL
jgi:hypothetical protein